MVQETIKVVQETEAKADQILRDAQEQCAAIVEKAQADAKQLKDHEIQEAKAKAQSAMEVSQKESDQAMAGVESDIQKEIAALKELAAAKEAQAIEGIISQLY